jgi:hypothetical protein
MLGWTCFWFGHVWPKCFWPCLANVFWAFFGKNNNKKKICYQILVHFFRLNFGLKKILSQNMGNFIFRLVQQQYCKWTLNDNKMWYCSVYKFNVGRVKNWSRLIFTNFCWNLRIKARYFDGNDLCLIWLLTDWIVSLYSSNAIFFRILVVWGWDSLLLLLRMIQWFCINCPY